LQQGRNFGSHILTFHRRIRLSFGYVMILNVTYMLTGGIVNSRLHLRAVTGGTFLENHPSRQPCYINHPSRRYINVSPLDWSVFWICCSSRCYINSERLRSETNTPTRNCISRTVGLQFSGQFGIVLISGDLTV